MTAIPFLRPAGFPEDVIAAFSTRNGGVSGEPFGMNLSYRVGDLEENVRKNRELFFGAFGVQQDELAIPGQVHSGTVLHVDRPGTYPECDALVTTVPRVFLCVSFADCVPILLVDPLAGVVAGVHAGWRGTASRILSAAIRVMIKQGASARSILACIGPAAGGCCYQVGPDVAEVFEPRFLRHERSGVCVDLQAANAAQLAETGVALDHIEVMERCTIMEAGEFHSYRRDRERSGRMMGFVGFSSKR